MSLQIVFPYSTGTHCPQEAAGNVTPDHLGQSPSHLTARMDEFSFDAVYFIIQQQLLKYV